MVFSTGAPVCTVTWNTPLVFVTLKMALRFDSDGILNPVEFSSDIPPELVNYSAKPARSVSR